MNDAAATPAKENPPNAPPRIGEGPASRRDVTLDRLAIGMFLLLAVEFVLGMILALFASLPTGASTVTLLSSAPVLDLHIVLAVLIIGISARALVLAFRAPGSLARWASGLALGSALVATFAGVAFAFGGQDPSASMVMAVGFLGILLGAFLLRGYATATPQLHGPDVPPTRGPIPGGR
jgi:hypothetical protein